MPALLLEASEAADVVTVPTRTVLALDGAGPPAAAMFQAAIAAIYGVTYTLKFARKRVGGDFRIGPLEGRWTSSLVGEEFVDAPPETWIWQLRMAVPADVTPAEVQAAIFTATHRRGGKLEGSQEATAVRLVALPAQRVGRALHVGPYAEEPRTFARIAAAVAAAGERPAFSHLEIYLGDPRRTRPEALRTVLVRELASDAAA